jgi:hypothetical protein
VVLAGCSSTSTPAGSTATNPPAAKPAGSWLYPNGDPIRYTGVLIALDHATGAIVYQRKLPTSANAPYTVR